MVWLQPFEHTCLSAGQHASTAMPLEENVGWGVRSTELGTSPATWGHKASTR